MSPTDKPRIITAHKSNLIKRAEAKAKIREGYRKCLGCNLSKHESDFYKHHETKCKECMSAYNSEWYADNKKKISARRKVLYKLKKESIKQSQV